LRSRKKSTGDCKVSKSAQVLGLPFKDSFELTPVCRGSYFFGYTAENSHHLKARIISKDPLYQEEKIPARNRADVK
jgi:hypothetical protein